VRPILLRDEDPPADAVIVVRGGVLSADSVRRTVERCRRQFGFLGVSVYSAVEMTLPQLISAVPQIGPVRYRQLRLSTFGALRSAGFPVWPTLAFPHFSIVLPDVDDETLARLEATFGPPEPNPGADALSRG
jgi:hypothetical protein